MMKRSKINQAGETIIEVLLSAVILGFTITTVFVIARRSLHTGQAASERVQALAIAETQIERLKYLANQSSSNVFSQTGNFCVADSLTIVGAPSNMCGVSGFPTNSIEVLIDHVANPDGLNSTYDENTFTVSVSWDRVGGAEQNERLVLVYRLHPGVAP